jgi:hypothetical protein
MTKEQLIDLMRQNGDSIITYRSAESKKLKYNVCTLDVEDNDYISGKQNRAKESDSTVLMFCWDADAYRLINPDSVTSVVPLASAMKERANGR